MDSYSDSRLSFTESANALRDGTIDVGFWSVGPGTSSILDLATTHDIHIISLTPEQTAKVLAANETYSDVELKGGISWFSERSAQGKRHPQGPRRLHAFRVFPHQADSGGQQPLAFQEVEVGAHGAEPPGQAALGAQVEDGHVGEHAVAQDDGGPMGL